MSMKKVKMVGLLLSTGKWVVPSCVKIDFHTRPMAKKT